MAVSGRVTGLAVGLDVPGRAEGHDGHAEHGEQHGAHAAGLGEGDALVVLDGDDRDGGALRVGVVYLPGLQDAGVLVVRGGDGYSLSEP